MNKRIISQGSISQSLINLLSNSVKYTEKGSVRITTRLIRSSELGVWNSFNKLSLRGDDEAISKDEIPRSARTDNDFDFVEISVEDTGIGIAEIEMPKLFEPFERLDTHLKIKAGGTCLGLYLTRKIATDILHGSVLVQSKEGQGSTFTLRIPRDLHKTTDMDTIINI